MTDSTASLAGTRLVGHLACPAELLHANFIYVSFLGRPDLLDTVPML